MNKIKYIIRDRQAGNIIDEFETREAAEAAIREYEAQDRADGNYEPDFYEVAEVEAKESYEVWLVSNGRLDDFARGITGAGFPDACRLWETYDSLDDVRKAYADWAVENFEDETDMRDSAFAAALGDASLDDVDAVAKADAIADEACRKYVEECVASLRIEWQNDMKYVICRKVLEPENGDTEFVEIV